MAYEEHQDQWTEGAQKGAWSWSNILSTVAGVAILGTVATALTATVVIGGGAFLLIGVPLLLFTSPIWIPLAIGGTVLGGGAIFLIGGGILTVLTVSWMYNYFRGPAQRQLQDLKGRGEELAGQFVDRAKQGTRQIAGQAEEGSDWAKGQARQTRQQFAS